MDRGRFGGQMIPSFTMGSAMPSALVLFVAGFCLTICDLNHLALVIQLTIGRSSAVSAFDARPLTLAKIARSALRTGETDNPCSPVLQERDQFSANIGWTTHSQLIVRKISGALSGGRRRERESRRVSLM